MQLTRYIVLLVLLPGVLSSQSLIRKEIRGLEGFYKNSGIAIADYNQDGHEDIYIVAYQDFDEYRKSTWNRLLKNNNDATFSDKTKEAGLFGTYDYNQSLPELPYSFLGQFKHGASWGDFNNDGFPDLFLTNYRYNKLYLNNANGSFSEVTNESGILSDTPCYSTSALWFDYNHDGWLDLLISAWAFCEQNYLYENNKDGTFTDVSEKIDGFDIGLGLTNNTETWMTLPLDVNSDQWTDLLFVTDFSASTLLVNTGGEFTDQTEQYGILDSDNTMGATLADFNNDGYFDVFTSDIDNNSLWLGSGSGFNNVASELALDSTNWSWHAEAADINLDGYEDLLISNGYPGGFSNYYFENNAVADLGFTDKSAENLPDVNYSMSFKPFDFDHDGDLDVIFGAIDSSPVFYENVTVNSNNIETPNWLKIKLVGEQSNRDGLGSVITITLQDDSVLKKYYSGVGFMTQSLLPVHFGVGVEDVIKEIQITWPSGLVDVYTNLQVNNQYLAIEGTSLEINNYSSEKVYGCTDPNSCSYNLNATISDGTCQYLEAHEINGPGTSGIHNTEFYTYPGAQTSSFDWMLDGGEILSGQGTNKIEVRWHIGDQGTVSVTEIGDCYSQESILDVDLTISQPDTSYSTARYWNEILLEAIRKDFARPTVHARNLFHISTAMYDVWQLYSGQGQSYFFNNEFDEIYSWTKELNKEERAEAIKESLSFAAYRLILYRFRNSPGKEFTYNKAKVLMTQLGYDHSYSVADYKSGVPADLGNYIADEVIRLTKYDGANELGDYANLQYTPINEPLAPNYAGNPNCQYPNKWQPLQLNTFIDQSGNLIEDNTPDFLSPEWGSVTPFALTSDELKIYNRNGDQYYVYHDPGHPPYLDENTATNELYNWGFSMVSIWGSHLDPNDGVVWDISPGAIGNINLQDIPVEFEDHDQFYNYLEGGDIGTGYTVNPVTGNPYSAQLVPRADYARVLAEFWADGPDSETPPGHWYTILNYVNDHDDLVKKLSGDGAVLDDLEWDVKAYFTLGGAMHDAAISAWGVKGWYDYIRPISAIRYMAGKGQSSEPEADDYDVNGIPLVSGYIERVIQGDPLAGVNEEHLGKIKVKTWKGHDYIDDTESEYAGVGWILAENWWPYQRPSFVTPPFAGYVSGHSTYSRAAAEVLTSLTGSEYFPGGMGEFNAKKNEFLVFEEGPSVDVVLQWATYQDASDQCSLSRIWGGIHPPADDLPGRHIGYAVGKNAFSLALEYFNTNTILAADEPLEIETYFAYPNPVQNHLVKISPALADDVILYDVLGNQYQVERVRNHENYSEIKLRSDLKSGVYILSSSNVQIKVLIK